MPCARSGAFAIFSLTGASYCDKQTAVGLASDARFLTQRPCGVCTEEVNSSGRREVCDLLLLLCQVYPPPTGPVRAQLSTVPRNDLHSRIHCSHIVSRLADCAFRYVLIGALERCLNWVTVYGQPSLICACSAHTV